MTFTAKRDTGLEYTFTGCKVKVKDRGRRREGDGAPLGRGRRGELLAHHEGLAPATDLTGITAIKAPVVKGAPLDWNGVRSRPPASSSIPAWPSFIETVGDADNKAGVQITNGDPRGSIKAYYLAQNMIDFEAAASILLAMCCGTRLNGWAIYVPKAQSLSPAFQDRKTGSSARTFRSRRATTRPIRSSRSGLLSFSRRPVRERPRSRAGGRAGGRSRASGAASEGAAALVLLFDGDRLVRVHRSRCPRAVHLSPLRGRDVPPPPDPLGEVDRPPERLDPRGRTSSPARGLRARRREGRPSSMVGSLTLEALRANLDPASRRSSPG